MRQLALVLATCCAWTTAAYAERPLDYNLQAPGPHQDLKDHTLYELKFSCQRGNGLSADSDNVLTKIANWFVHPNEVANHYVIISNDLAQPDPSDQGKIKLPAKAISILPLFSIKGDSVVSNFGSCENSIYVQASQRIYLIPTVAWSAQYKEGPALAALYQATKLISPLWSIFNPASIPAAIASKITNVQATEEPIKSILTSMDQDKNYGESQRLAKGRYVITTKYSTVTLQVSELPSVVKAASDDIRRDFRAALDAAPEKIDATNFTAMCGQIATTLANAGFSQNEDVPYALGYLASKSLSTPPEIIHCLGWPYAVKAAGLGNILWAWIPEAKRVTEQAASDVYPPGTSPKPIQPDFSTIEDRTDDFIRALSRVSKNQKPDGTLPATFIAELKALMTATVLINDKTDAATFDNLAPLDAQKLGETFTAKDYFRYGCYAQVTEKFGSNLDGAVVMFVMFRTPKDAPATTFDTALGVRPFFDKGLVSRLTITDKQRWITAALDSNNWNCNGFAVQKPAGGQAAALPSR